MSAAPDDPSPAGPAPGATGGHELEVDVTAFLPEGTILAGDDVDAPEGAEATDDPGPPDTAAAAPVTAGTTAPAWSATLAVRPEPEADDVPVAADEGPEPGVGPARAVAMAADEAAWAATAPVDPPPDAATEPEPAPEPETVEAEAEHQAEPELEAEPTGPEAAADVEEPEGAAATPASPPEPVGDGSAPVAQVDVAGADQLDPPAAEAAPAPAAPEPEAAPRPAPVDLGALAQLEVDLAAVDAAIAAVDEGTYGTCAICGSSIDDDLLAGDPVRRGCAAHPEGATLG